MKRIKQKKSKLPKKLKEMIKLADNGDGDYETYVCKIFFGKIPGYKPSIEKFLECAEKGWEYAQTHSSYAYADGRTPHIPQNPKKLLECAEKGWRKAQILVASAYVTGRFGFEKNLEKSEELKKKWNIDWDLPG